MDAASKIASFRVANISVLYVFAAYTTFFSNSQKLNSYVKGMHSRRLQEGVLRLANLSVLYRSMCVKTFHDFLQRPLENVFVYNTAEAGTQIESVSERSKSHRTI